MLLNEFLKVHKKAEELESAAAKQGAINAELKRTIAKQETTIAQMKKGMDALVALVKEQDSKIQKVRDRIGMEKPTTEVVVNNP